MSIFQHFKHLCIDVNDHLLLIQMDFDSFNDSKSQLISESLFLTLSFDFCVRNFKLSIEEIINVSCEPILSCKSLEIRKR